jgi:hypothetical protein
MKRLAVIGLFAASTAAAQPPPPAPVVVAEPAPTTQSVLPNLFATMLGTTIEVRFDYSDIDQIDLTVFNALAHVQYLTPQGFGGYVRVPFGYVEENEDSGFSFGGSGIGNIEVGGLFVAKLGPQTDVLARGGVSIDTASDDDDLALTLSTVLPRLIDIYATGLQTTWGRGQGQIRHAVNSLRFGAAVGMDVPIAGDGADQDGFTGVLNFVAAAGFQQGKVGVGFSFVMLQIVDDEDAGEDNVTGLNLDVDYEMNPNARLFLQIGLSLEDNADGTSIGLGTRVTF